MKYKKTIILISLLALTACEKEIDKNEPSTLATNIGDDSFPTVDLLEKSKVAKLLVDAMSISELEWGDDNSPATLKNTPYTGWVKHSSESASGLGYLFDGVEHGPFLIKYANGKPKLSGFYSSGLRSGKWITWSEDGNLKNEELWVDGKMVDKL